MSQLFKMGTVLESPKGKVRKYLSIFQNAFAFHLAILQFDTDAKIQRQLQQEKFNGFAFQRSSTDSPRWLQQMSEKANVSESRLLRL